MLLLTLLLALTLHIQQPAPVPVAQLRIEDFRPVLLEPDSDDPPLARVRPGDVVLIYQVDGDWARGEIGWISMEGLQPEAAVVEYGAEFDDDLMLSVRPNGDPALEMSSDQLAGVTAIFDDQALVYGRNVAGWTALDNIQLTEPSPDVQDFVERDAYVKVEAAELLVIPEESEPLASVEPLGRRVRVLFSDEDWALVRSQHAIGWSRPSNFDLAPGIIARGTMNAGPVNLRESPVDGAVLTIVDYLEQVRILERDGDWLYVQLSDVRGAVEGWLAAQFVDYEEVE
jgi:hypothetical protein